MFWGWGFCSSTGLAYNCFWLTRGCCQGLGNERLVDWTKVNLDSAALYLWVMNKSDD